jgi:hypothetical protein
MTRRWQASRPGFATLSKFPCPWTGKAANCTLDCCDFRPGARELLVRFADAVELARGLGGDLAHVTAAASKGAEQVSRIAGTLALWRDLNAAEVSPADMANGIAAVQHARSEAARLADAATVPAETDRAERPRLWLLDTGSHAEILPGELVRHAPIRALRESPAARAALGNLEMHGWPVPLATVAMARGAPRKEGWRFVRWAGARGSST